MGLMTTANIRNKQHSHSIEKIPTRAPSNSICSASVRCVYHTKCALVRQTVPQSADNKQNKDE